MCGEENQLSGGQNHKAETNLALRIGLKIQFLEFRYVQLYLVECKKFYLFFVGS